jgi:hypothetical protein
MDNGRRRDRRPGLFPGWRGSKSRGRQGSVLAPFQVIDERRNIEKADVARADCNVNRDPVRSEIAEEHHAADVKSRRVAEPLVGCGVIRSIFRLSCGLKAPVPVRFL